MLKSSPVTHNVNSFLTYMYLEFSQETVFLLLELEEHTKIISILHSILIKRTELLTIFPLLCLYLYNWDISLRSAYILHSFNKNRDQLHNNYYFYFVTSLYCSRHICFKDITESLFAKFSQIHLGCYKEAIASWNP